MISRYRDNKFWQYITQKFHEKLLNDPILRPAFRSRSTSESEMIILNILRAGFGEDDIYYGDAIREAHRDKGITPDQVNRFVGLFKAVLHEAEIDDEEVNIIISRVSFYGNIINEVNS